MTIGDIIKLYNTKLDRLDIDLILAHSLGKTREFILTHPEKTIAKKQKTIAKKNIARRMRGEPIAYITGRKEFYGLDFVVNKDTLIPRPETELLVELALDELKVKSQKSKVIIADIGTGSGNIIISTAHSVQHPANSKNIKYFAIDISKKALKIAKQNAKKYGLDKKIKFIYGDLLKPLFNKFRKEKLIIITNLPYLDTGWKNLLKSSETKGLKFEPCIALYAGEDGLDSYRKLANQLELFTKQTENDITIFCEIGHLQLKSMRKIFSFAKNISFIKDLAGRWRICKINL